MKTSFRFHPGAAIAALVAWATVARADNPQMPEYSFTPGAVISISSNSFVVVNAGQPTVFQSAGPPVVCGGTLTPDYDPNCIFAGFAGGGVSLSCPPDVTVNCSAGQAVPVNYTNMLIATNQCGPSIYSVCDPPSGSQFQIGVTEVHCRVPQPGDPGWLPGYAGLNLAALFPPCSFTVTVRCPVFIIQQPQSQSVPAGEPATFTVIADGARPLAYQWFRNNAIIPDATNAYYAIAAVQAGDAGSYTVTIVNADSPDGVTSPPATLTVNTPPAITCPNNPIVATVPCGSNCVAVPYPDPTVINGVLLGCTPPSGFCFPLGPTPVTCTATNACGSTNCTFTVTVNSNCPPAFIANLLAWDSFEYVAGTALAGYNGGGGQSGGGGWAGNWSTRFFSTSVTNQSDSLVPPSLPDYATAGGRAAANVLPNQGDIVERALNIANTNQELWLSVVLSASGRYASPSGSVTERFFWWFDDGSHIEVGPYAGGAGESNYWALNQNVNPVRRPVEANVSTLLVLQVSNVSPFVHNVRCFVNPPLGASVPALADAEFTYNNLPMGRLTNVQVILGNDSASPAPFALDEVRVASTYSKINGDFLACPRPNLVFNGSFELPDLFDLPYMNVLGADSTSIPGWHTLSTAPYDHGVELYRVLRADDPLPLPTTVSHGVAADGDQAVDLAPAFGIGGGIAQTFPTEIGKTYHVWFKMGTSRTNGHTGHASLTAKITTETAEHEAHTATESAELVWELKNFEFTATTLSSTLMFTTGDNPAESYVNLDDVHVSECEPPFCIDQPSCPDITVDCTNGDSGNLVEYHPTAINRCSPTNLPTVVCVPPSPSRFFKGPPTPVVCTFTAGAETRPCSFTVTVVDSTPPVISWAPDKEVECGDPWDFDPPTVTDNCCYDIIDLGVTTNTFTGQTCGYEYTKKWQVTDCGAGIWENTQTVRATVTRPPVFTNCPTDRVVRVDASGRPLPAYSVLLRLTGTGAQGSYPSGALVCGDDGYLYGTTAYGGPRGGGTLFRIQTDGRDYRLVHAFPAPEGDGTTPTAGLVKGTDGMLYGTTAGTYWVSRYGTGVLFRVKYDGSAYQVTHWFEDSVTGFSPSQLVQGIDGKFYGATQGRSAGAASAGSVVFQVNADGTDFQTLHPFDFPPGLCDPCGYAPAKILQGLDRALYGMVVQGGGGERGRVFKLTPGPTPTYTPLHDFFVPDPLPGSSIQSDLIEGSDGSLYGIISNGRPGQLALVFKLNEDGSGFTPLVEILGAVEPYTWFPVHLIEGTDGRLYGTVGAGGTAGNGFVFQMNKDGVGGYLVLHEFTGSGGDGSKPNSLKVASDGVLYGTTEHGGAADFGTVFRYDPRLAWDLEQPAATDACSGTGVTITELPRMPSGSCPQVITRTWVATDCAGHTATCSQTVTLYRDCVQVFDGLPNSLVGSAIAEVRSNQIAVHNFSNLMDQSVPRDGISLGLGAAQFGRVSFECLDAAALPDGANLTFRAIGRVNETNGLPIATFQAVDMGNEIEYRARFDALGDVPLRAMVYDSNTVVSSVRIPTGPGLPPIARVSGAAGDARITPYLSAGGYPEMILEWPLTRPAIALAGDAIPMGNRLVIKPDVPKVAFPDRALDLANDVVNAGLNFFWQDSSNSIVQHVFIGSLSEIQILASGVPQVVILDEQVGMFGMAHQAGGGTLIRGEGDSLLLDAVPDGLPEGAVVEVLAGGGDAWNGARTDADLRFVIPTEPNNPVPDGAFLKTGIMGTMFGTNAPLASVQITQVASNSFSLDGGANWQTAEVWRDGVLVGATAPLNGLVGTFGKWPTMAGVRSQGPDSTNVFLSFGWNTDITLNLAGVGSFTGNELKVGYINHPFPADAGGFNLGFGGGLARLRLIDEVVAPAGLYFQGLAHQAVGSASLTVVSNALVVSNLVANASFGASVELGDAEGGTITLSGLELPSAPEGSTVEIRSRGTFNAIPAPPLGTLRLAKLAAGVRASVDYTPIGASNATAVILDGATVVDATENFLSTDFPPAQTIRVNALRIWTPNGGLEEVITFEDRQFISLNGGSPVLGDRILITPAPSTPYPSTVQTVSRLDIVGAGLPSFRILAEELDKFHRGHVAMDQATLLASGDWVRVGNIDAFPPAGTYFPTRGIYFPVIGKDTFAAYWRPIDPFDQAPPGATLRASREGSVNGGPTIPVAISQVTSLGAQKEIVADLSALGATSRLVEVLSNNVVIFSNTLDGATGLVARSADWPAGFKGGHDQSANSNVYSAWIWVSPINIEIGGFSIWGHTGNELRVSAWPSGPGWVSVSGVRLQAAGLPGINLVADIAEILAPVITIPPTDQSAIAGATVSFSVGVMSDETPTFQWSKDGVAIPGATGQTLTLTNVQCGDAGSYTVNVSNSGGSVTSPPAFLTVSPCCISIQCPTNTFFVACGSNCVLVHFTVWATNRCSSNPVPVVTDWPSNFCFPLGQTVVHATAIDGGESNQCSFTITVLSNCPTITPQLVDLRRLQSNSLTRPALHFDGGLPTSVEALIPGTNSLGDGVVRALNHLNAYKNLYFLRDPYADLYLLRRKTDATGQHIHFGQKVNDTPVFGAGLAVHLDGDGNFTGSNGRWLRDVPTFPAPPPLSQAAAETVALNAAGGAAPQVIGASRLVYFNEGLITGEQTPTYQTWRVTVLGGQPDDAGATSWTVLVDAHNGEVRQRLPRMRTHDARRDFSILSARNMGSSYGFFNLSELNAASVEWFNESGPTAYPGPAADGCLDAQHVSAFVRQSYDYFFNNFHRHGWDDHDRQIRAFTHVGGLLGTRDQFVNAGFYPDWVVLLFGECWPTLDVVAHEYTHGITHFTADLGISDQPGALNESYSDFFGAMVDAEDWLFGEDMPPGAFPGCLPPMRSLADPPSVVCRQPDHMSAALSGDGIGFARRTPTWPIDNGGVHRNNGIPNKAAYLLTQGGTHNGITVPGMGRIKAQRLYYDVLTTSLNPMSQFIDARNASVAKAREYVRLGLYGFTVQNVCAVINAFAAVGLGPRDLDCDGVEDPDDPDDDGDGVADGIDNAPYNFNPDQGDLDHDGIPDVLDPDIDGDGVLNADDNAPWNWNPDQADTDGDGVPDVIDNAPTIPNPGQEDLDHDGIPDVLDDDWDGDGINNVDDNCPRNYNKDQLDLDHNGVGLACDSDEFCLYWRGCTLPIGFRFSPNGNLTNGIFVPPYVSLIEASLPKLYRCYADGPGCWDYMPEDFVQKFAVTLPASNLEARIIDEEGSEVARSLPGSTLRTFAFSPKADAYYVAPGQGPGIHPPYVGTRYYLELRPGAQTPLETDLPISFSSSGSISAAGILSVKFVNGIPVLQLDGAANRKYRIEVSSDLQNWTPIKTDVSPDGLIEFQDFQGQFEQRYYRGALLP